MADTMPVVVWALEMHCGLRVGENASLPGKGAEALWVAQYISDALSGKEGATRVAGDVFVWGTTQKIAPGNAEGRRWREYPSKGCVISETFKDVEGGLDGIWKMCGGCVANITLGRLAGCKGIISQSAHSRDLDKRLFEIISRMELSGEIAMALPQTKPIWYGLWAISPIPQKSLPVLKTLMTELAALVSNRQRDQYNLFIQAIEVSLSRNLNLHVKLGPPGHTDFGILTTFPHCPRSE